MKPFERALRLSCVVGIAACAAACANPQPPSTEPKQAPDFTLTALDGSKLALSQQRGQVILLDFWATWCEPCYDAIPVFERLNNKYRGQGFQVLGVNVDGGAENVPEFVRRFKMTYKVLLDSDFDVMRAYKVRGIPNMFLLDKRGRIRKHWVGLDDDLERAVETEVQKLLQEA